MQELDLGILDKYLFASRWGVYNHDNLTLKLHQKNSCLNEGWLFIDRFKLGSLLKMTNKEVLAQFIHKPT